MNLQKTLPVVSSIVIILIVAVVRDRSRTLAAIFAVMPINMPLALWVLASGGSDDAMVLMNYVRTLIIGLIPAFIWLGVVFIFLKLGWTLLGSIVIAYVVWVALIAALLWLRILTVS